MIKEGNVRITVTLSSNTNDAIRGCCKQIGCRVSDLIQELLTEFFNEYNGGVRMRFSNNNESFSFDEDTALYNLAVHYMDDDIRESLHRDIAPCTPNEFIIAYCRKDPGFVGFLEHELGIILEGVEKNE